MSTTRTFQAMLNEFLPNELLMEELIKRDWILTNVEKNNSWKGGKLIVAFMGQQASSVAFGSLTGSTDIAEYSYIRGSVDDYKEAWGSLIFNQRDLMDHSGRIKEDSFLKILPDQIDQFIEYMKFVCSVQLGTGPHFATVTDATNAATGIMIVDKVDRFSLAQKCQIDDDNSSPLTVYVIAINVNTSAVTFSATRGGAAVDISAYTVAQNAKLYQDGAQSNSFSSLKDQLLSAANGGSATIFGQTKLSYPFLQAINYSGASVTTSNILSQLFDFYTDVRKKARGGKADTFLMSYKWGGACMKAMETTPYQGQYQVSVADRKASVYGWDEIIIRSVKGTLKIVMIQEWDDTSIVALDMSAVKFYSNGFFKKRKGPNGNEYFEVRNTTGYQYIVDTCLFGELVVNKPGNCGIMYGIP